MHNSHIAIFSASTLFLIVGCSDGNKSHDESNALGVNGSKVQKPIALKNLVVGMDVKSIKSAKSLSGREYIFDFDYFGGKRSFIASTNEKGYIYKYATNLDGSFDSLKSALEDKLTKNNDKPVAFDCKSGSIEPDSSAVIKNRTCKVSGESDVLIIKETIIQPTAKYAGVTQLPTVILSIELEGTVLGAEVRTAEENARGERERASATLRKNDI